MKSFIHLIFNSLLNSHLLNSIIPTNVIRKRGSNIFTPVILVGTEWPNLAAATDAIGKNILCYNIIASATLIFIWYNIALPCHAKCHDIYAFTYIYIDFTKCPINNFQDVFLIYYGGRGGGGWTSYTAVYRRAPGIGYTFKAAKYL